MAIKVKRRNSLLQRVADWFAPPHVRETAKKLKDEKSPKVVEKVFIPPPATKDLTPPKTWSLTKIENRPQMVFLDVDQMGATIPRAHEYATSRARERELSGYSYLEIPADDKLMVQFTTEDPHDTLMIFSPEYGSNCHPIFGIKFKVAKPVSNMDWRAV